MGNVAIWNGLFAKILRTNINLFDQKYILSLTSDPTVVATNAPAGSIGMYNSGVAGDLYIKQDAGTTTNWDLLSIISGSISPNALVATDAGSHAVSATVSSPLVFSSDNLSINSGNLTDAGTDGIVITGGTNAVLGSGTSIAQFAASLSQNGYLSSANFTTFNNKLSPTLASGDIFVGNGSNVATAVAMSGDATLSNTGALTLATVNSNVGTFGSSTSIPTFTVNAKGLITAVSGNVVIAPAGTLTGTTLASNVVSSSLTSVGTISSGTWNGSTITVPYGGTGDTSFTAYSVLCGGTTSGGALQNVSGLGTTGQLLTSNGAGSLPTWQSPATSGTVTSVALTVPAFLSVSGSPITSSGTLAVSFSGSALPIANGGTSQTTAQGARGSSGLNIDELTTFSNTNYTALSTDRSIAQIGTLTGAVTVTLPAANTVNPGQLMYIYDSSGTVTTTNTITITAYAGDTINGAGSKTIRSAYGYIYLVSNGSNGWNTGVQEIGRGGTALSTLPSNGQLLIGSSTNSNYVLSTLTAGTGISVVNGAGSITLSTTGAPPTGAAGGDLGGTYPNPTVVSVADVTTGVLSITNGGTGQTTKTAAFDALSPLTTAGDLLYYNGTHNVRLGIGSTGQTITVVAGEPAWTTPTNGTVTSVALTSPGVLYTVTGSPVTTSGTLQLNLISQTANTVLAAPNGSNGNPSFRALALQDLPSGSQQFITSGTTFTTAANITATTRFKFTLIGGGGGSGGSAGSNAKSPGAGGGAGIIVYLTGLTASTPYTIAIGAGGSGGTTAPTAGGNGGNTTLTVGATTYTAGGGSGSVGAINGFGGFGGTATNGTIVINGGEGGSSGPANTSTISGYGGSSPFGFGSGGEAIYSNAVYGIAFPGIGYGGGAGGAGSLCAGNVGAPGCILVEWGV
jgi:hypothetical protein